MEENTIAFDDFNDLVTHYNLGKASLYFLQEDEMIILLNKRAFLTGYEDLLDYYGSRIFGPRQNESERTLGYATNFLAITENINVIQSLVESFRLDVDNIPIKKEKIAMELGEKYSKGNENQLINIRFPEPFTIGGQLVYDKRDYTLATLPNSLLHEAIYKFDKALNDRFSKIKCSDQEKFYLGVDKDGNPIQCETLLDAINYFVRLRAQNEEKEHGTRTASGRK